MGHGGGKFGGLVEFHTVNAGLNPLPCILGLWSDAEAGGAPMRNNGTKPNRDPGMGKVITVAFSSCSRNFSLSEQHPVLALCLLGGSSSLSVALFTSQNTGSSRRD